MSCQSTGNAARKIPESPPIVKSAMNPSAHSIGVSNEMFPRQSVASQLKIFTPVGTAITIDETMKNVSARVGSPTANMWWPQTMNPRNAIATVESATAL